MLNGELLDVHHIDVQFGFGFRSGMKEVEDSQKCSGGD